MSAGSVVARHYQTRQPVTLTWSEGRITAIEPATRPPAQDVWIAPGLIELQINGYANVNYWSLPLSTEDLTTSMRCLRRDGVSRILLTLTTDHWPQMIAKLKAVQAARKQSPEVRAAIAGFHFEGPFMSNVAGYVGAHEPHKMIDPTAAHIRELRELTGSDPVLLTMAPERNGVIEAIRLAASLGMRVSMGHTNASKEVIAAAIDAGLSAYTHFGNGIPQAIDRHDNILWRVLQFPSVTLGVIPDGVHVSPAFFRIIHRMVDPKKLYYTTDAVHPGGMPPGTFKFGDMDMVVGEDQVVRKPGETNFSGSALRPLEGVFRAVEMLGCAWQDAWVRFSQQPADFMGMGELLAPGQPADFCLIDHDANAPTTVRSYAGGDLRSTLPAAARMRSAGIEVAAKT
ncbi:MAG: N-acetylglucosamine-6-phosphate deacetylase [Planctomycetes bacterium]|nr:N-acetylglucosamine-6-phosphate deacetylase [Planctomycetota bacterium]